ncbi:type II toxin-antitoxin system RelE/ParE family toxin [Oxalobacter formigenes]|uniref:transcriptional regulator n=1 Tax=Oxalobacter formigenes TaxID=847 RepID=UPI0022AF3141|nr:transcriptional regulator [Oxalobacter formigenes]WAW06092.1 type II toxin-antitoxin system RelE/ParE family toxin [Oxalobacter formigenes]
MLMYTVIETDIFQKHISNIWTEEERLEFVSWIANNPLAGDVVPRAGGVRKVRWKRSGMGKSGGIRVIYYNMFDDGEIWLLIAYSKSKFDNLPPNVLLKLKELING